MENYHALVTGAASGLGWGCVQRLAPKLRKISLCDVNVEAGTRRCAELQRQCPAVQVQFLPLDLADVGSVDQLADVLLQQAEPLDILVNNAGIFPPAQRVLNARGQELCFAIAHLGHFRLTHRLWPLLQAAQAARVISVTSMVQKNARLELDNLDLARNYSPLKAYQQAKLSCLLFALELQRRMDAQAQQTIRSYAVHPGVCRSKLGLNQPRRTDDPWLERLKSWGMALGLATFAQGAKRAAAPLELAALGHAPGGSFIGPRGPWEVAGPPGLCRPGAAARDPLLAQELWLRSERITGVKWNFSD